MRGPRKFFLFLAKNNEKIVLGDQGDVTPFRISKFLRKSRIYREKSTKIVKKLNCCKKSNFVKKKAFYNKKSSFTYHQAINVLKIISDFVKNKFYCLIKKLLFF